jgi:hypothetical protein
MHMRASRFLKLTILSVLVGCSVLVYAQDEKPQDKPTQKEEAKPEPKQDQSKPLKQDKQEPKQDKQDKEEVKQDQKQEQKESHDQMKPQGQERPEQQMERAQPQAQGHPEKAGNARPAGKGGHIPDDKFHANFGRSHTFSARTVIVQGQPQFQYSGYSFQLVDAWPEGWAYTDDCYIDYIDGEYFLIDLLHPGVRVAVFVVM